MLLAPIFATAAFHPKAYPVSGDIISGSYIVALKPEATLQKSLSHVFTMGALDKVGFLYGNRDGSTFKGFSLHSCDEKLAIDIADTDDVLAIEQDQMAYAFALQTNPVWGLDRIDQASPTLDSLYYFKDSAGSGVDMYTLDTGIRYNHQDFQGRAKFFFSALSDDGGDRNGHGTHVSSTMAGSTYGVAKKANLFSVKVLGDNGSGANSGVIAGVELSMVLLLPEAAQRLLTCP
jgi:subtilisin family serine protease